MKEKDGTPRGFSFVTFVHASSAQRLLEERLISLNGVRMEAKPCLPHESERNKDLAGATGVNAVNSGRLLPPPAPAPQRTWGSGTLNLQKTEARPGADKDLWPAIRGDVGESAASVGQVR